MFKAKILGVVAVLLPAIVWADESKSPDQQAIDNFKICVEQVVAKGGAEASINSECSVSKAALDSRIPGLSGSIIHHLLNGEQS